MTAGLAVIHLPWTSPVVLQIFKHHLPAHLVFDLLAYSGGFRLYLWRRSRGGVRLEANAQAWLFLGCAVGALSGARLLAWLEHAEFYWAIRNDRDFWLGGKTIIGGLLGGWLGIEIAKKCCRVQQSTGDAFVFPLIGGIAVGRIGCFLTGLPDLTCGLPTELPWGVDFGDGVGRHPAQLYEMLFLVCLALLLPGLSRRFPFAGSSFRLFMTAYLSFRFLSEFYKPRTELFLQLSPLQWASLIGSAVAIRSLFQCQIALTSTSS